MQLDTSKNVKNNISHYLIEFNEDSVDKKNKHTLQTILDGSLKYLSVEQLYQEYP